ncbi:MAG: hypothetical protein D6767_03890 [Candidatus Hydrogenedentota bacterium]|nr:MAG: hypothetical protein D6767_03890 [Candidatus Hydrogenedentota bacterium]
MRKIYFLFIASLFVAHCQLLREELRKNAPEVSLKKATLVGFDLNAAEVDFLYEIRNKINFGITFSRLKFQLFVDGKKLIDADNPKNVSLAPKGTSEFTIRQKFTYSEVADSLLNLFKKENVEVKLKGIVGVVVPKINESIEVPFEGSMTVPVPKLPKITFGKFRYVKANLNPFNPSARFELSFAITNPNPFPITIAPSGYSFQAAGKDLIRGQVKETLLKAKQQKMVKVPVVLKGKEIIDLVPKLRDFKSLDYKFSGEINLKTLGQPLRLPFTIP